MHITYFYEAVAVVTCGWKVVETSSMRAGSKQKRVTDCQRIFEWNWSQWNRLKQIPVLQDSCF